VSDHDIIIMAAMRIVGARRIMTAIDVSIGHKIRVFSHELSVLKERLRIHPSPLLRAYIQVYLPVSIRESAMMALDRLGVGHPTAAEVARVDDEMSRLSDPPL
jgi:hypothetical protein